MKKTILSIFILVFMLSFAACKDQNPTAAPATPTEKAASPSDAPTGQPEETQAPTSTPTEEPTPTPDESPKNVIGYVDGNSYVNNYLKIRFTLPNDWKFLSGEQLAQVLSMTGDMYGEDFANAGLDLSQQTIVMQALSKNGRNSIVMNVQELSLASSLVYSAMSSKGLAEKVLAESKELFPQIGIESSDEKINSFSFLGKNDYYLSYTASTVVIKDAKYISYLILNGKMLYTITMYSATNADITKLFDAFSKSADSEPARIDFDTNEPDLNANIIGSIQEDTYINELLDIFFTCPDTWTLIDGQSFAAYYGLSGDLYTDVKPEDLWALSQSPFIMDAYNEDMSCELKIAIERPIDASSFSSSPKELTKSIAALLPEQYSVLGFSCSEPEIFEMKIMGDTRYIVYYTLSNASVYYEIYQFFIPKDPYLVTVTYQTSSSIEPNIFNYFWNSISGSPDTSLIQKVNGLLGKIEGTKYVNEALGFSFDSTGTDWSITSGTELAQVFGRTRNIYSDPSYAELFLSGNDIILFDAYNPVADQEIAIYAQPFSRQIRSGLAPASFDSFMSLLKDNELSNFAAYGYDTEGKLETFSIAGKDITVVTIFASAADEQVEFSETYYLYGDIVISFNFYSYTGNKGDNAKICTMLKAN